MINILTSHDVETAARRVCRMIDEQTDTFNQLDAATGDGDMGSTLQIVARAVLADTSPFPTNLDQSFHRLAMTLARTSGSSLCAVLMTGLMSISKSIGPQRSCSVEEFIAKLEGALVAMQVRSRANFGDKTILDGLKAIVEASKKADTKAEFGHRSAAAAAEALAQFHDRPSQIGRARLAERKGIGLDDPGMVFLARAVDTARLSH